MELIGFITTANFRDAGESAALDQLGFSLGDIAGEFLGPGEWTPAPAGVSGENA